MSDVLDTRPFPIQAENTFDGRPVTVPWWIAELAVDEHRRQYSGSQTAESMAQRHGFGACEIALLLAQRIRRMEAEERLNRGPG